MTAPTFSPRLIGVAENTLRALLTSNLAGTGLTYHTWVLFNAVAQAGGETDRAQLTAIATDGLKIDKAAVDAAIASLVAAGLLRTPPGQLQLTEAGQERHQHLAPRFGTATATILRDLPEDDLAATARVLTTITQRANAILAS